MLANMKVLIAENEQRTLQFLSDILEKEGFDVKAVDNGYDAYQEYSFSAPEFVILDIEMPNMNGLEVCEKIRKEDKSTPVIFISARDRSPDKIKGLDAGADDYITKPFDIKEVVARIRAITRRCIENKKQEFSSKDFSMNHLKVMPQKLLAEANGGDLIELSLRDLKILSLLHDNKNKIVSRDTLLDHCWGRHITPESRTVDWHISQLRKKIEIDPKSPMIIQTVHGVGYKFEEE